MMVTQTTRTTEPAAVLERCQMPAQEIDWVLTADDPSIVHMLLELHAERLREELAERLAVLSEVEGSIARAGRGCPEPLGCSHPS